MQNIFNSKICLNFQNIVLLSLLGKPDLQKLVLRKIFENFQKRFSIDKITLIYFFNKSISAHRFFYRLKSVLAINIHIELILDLPSIYFTLRYNSSSPFWFKVGILYSNFSKKLV